MPFVLFKNFWALKCLAWTKEPLSWLMEAKRLLDFVCNWLWNKQSTESADYYIQQNKLNELSPPDVGWKMSVLTTGHAQTLICPYVLLHAPLKLFKHLKIFEHMGMNLFKSTHTHTHLYVPLNERTQYFLTSEL